MVTDIGNDVADDFDRDDDQRQQVYGLRAERADVEALRALARKEAVKVGRDVHWGDLVRAAVKVMVRTGKPVGGVGG